MKIKDDSPQSYILLVVHFWCCKWTSTLYLLGPLKMLKFLYCLASTPDCSCSSGSRWCQGLNVCLSLWHQVGCPLPVEEPRRSLSISQPLPSSIFENRENDLFLSVVLAFWKPGESRQIANRGPPNQQLSGGQALSRWCYFPSLPWSSLLLSSGFTRNLV